MDWSETDCAEIVRLLERYVDGEVPPEETTKVARHLEACAGCLDHKEFRERVQAVVRRKCRSDEPPPGLEERVRRTLTGTG